MISRFLEHKIRKELVRDNKKHNHRQYLRALQWQPKVRYWAGYHKKKLIFLGLVALISWNYELHISAYHSLLEIRSPKQFLHHLFFGSEKVQPTVNQQKIVGWRFQDSTLDLLTKLYHQTDKRLFFGVGRNYLFKVYSSMGLLQKPEEEAKFWRDGGFHKKRNQIVSGVGYKEFISLFSQGFKTLSKSRPDLTQEEYLRQFMDHFVEKGPQIEAWQKRFNKIRFSEYLKNLLSDNDKKLEQVTIIMRQNIDITYEEMQNKLIEYGMKGLGLRQKWVFWKNKEILFSLRQFNLHKRLSLTILDNRERFQLEKKLQVIEQELQRIGQQKQAVKKEYKSIYEQDLI